MSETGFMVEAGRMVDGPGSEFRVRFDEEVADGDVVVMAFKDPAPRYAVRANIPDIPGSPATAIRDEGADAACGDALDVAVLPLPGTPAEGMRRGPAEWPEMANDPRGTAPPIFVKYRGVELMWRPGRAVLQCEPEQAEALLAAVVEFTHYERELRRIEDEIANGWAGLEQDKALAFEVTAADLGRSETVGGRMGRVLQQRIRYARIEPHLYQPDTQLTAAAQKLGDELRDRGRIEGRLETVDGQLEVFEHFYEMSSQRMGEYRAAREEHVLEWVIIALLAAEALLMLAQAVWRHGR